MTHNVTVLTYMPSPSAPLPVWPVVVTGVLILAAAAALAWQRGRRPGRRPPRRRTRIFAAAFAGSGSAMALMAASVPAIGDARGLRVGQYELSIELTTPAHFLACLLLAGMLVGTGDLLFDALRPRRSRFWLILGAPLFAVFLIATLSMTGWFDPLASPPGIKQATFFVSALATGLIWWAWLPLPHHEVADIFE